MKIAFLGDSITMGYALTDMKDRFPTLIAKAWDIEELNFGIPGTLVAKAGMGRENGSAFLDRAEVIRGADLACIFGGTNDYFWSDTPIGEGEAEEKYFDFAVRSLMKSAEEWGMKEKTLFITPYKHHGVGNFKGGETYNTASEHDTTEVNFVGHVLEDYVNTILKAAEETGFRVLDLYHRNDFDWKTMTLDGCHPNPAGHRWLADQVEKALEEMR